MAASDAADGLEAGLLAAAGELSDTWAWAASRGVEHGAVVGCLKSLEVDGFLVSDAITTEELQLTEEAQGYVARGSPEKQLLAAVVAGAGAHNEAALNAALGEDLVKVGLGKAMKNKWISRDKATGCYSHLVRPARLKRLSAPCLTPPLSRIFDHRLHKWSATSSSINLHSLRAGRAMLRRSRRSSSGNLSRSCAFWVGPAMRLSPPPLPSFVPHPLSVHNPHSQQAHILLRASRAQVGADPCPAVRRPDEGAPRLWRVAQRNLPVVQF